MKKPILAMLSLSAIVLTSIPASTNALVPTPDENGDISFDLTAITFGGLNPISNAGEISVDPSIVEMLGYDPGRKWEVGDRPADIIKMGDVDAYDLGQLSLKGIAELQDLEFDPDAVDLKQLGYLEGETLSSLADKTDIGDLYVRDFPPLLERLEGNYGDRKINDLLDKDLKNSDVTREGREQSNQKVASSISKSVDSIDASGQKLVADAASKNSLEAQKYLEDLGLTPSSDVSDKETQELFDAFASDRRKQLDLDLEEYLATETEADSNAVNSYINEKISSYQADLSGESQRLLQQQTTKIVDRELANSTLDYRTQTTEYLNSQLPNIESDLANQTAPARDEIRESVTAEIGNVAGSIDIAGIDDIGDLPIGDLDLSSTSADTIPGIEDVPISEFDDYKNLAISEIPNLETLSANNFPSLPQMPQIIALIDLVLGEAEKYTMKTISGGGDGTITIPEDCHQGNSNGDCAHIEVGGFLGKGQRWVMGNSMDVDGGIGMLKNVGGGKEPTGRLPFPESPFKLIVNEPDETQDTVRLEFSFRFGFVDTFGNKHFTPYNAFTVPAVELKVDQWTYLGI